MGEWIDLRPVGLEFLEDAPLKVAIEAGLVCLPKAADMSTILRCRLDRRQHLWLSASSMLSLSAQGDKRVTS